MNSLKWYVVQTKPRQEFRAKENLENQGFTVFLPTCLVQKLKNAQVVEELSPLFSRYLFVQLGEASMNWSPIRSTRGVHQLIRFGRSAFPAHVPQNLINQLQANTIVIKRDLFKQNEHVTISDGPFRGLEGIFQKLVETPSGEMRAIILLEFLGKSQEISIDPEVLKAN